MKNRKVRRVNMMAFRRSERTFGFAFEGGGIISGVWLW
jgi:hypothetical protein